MTRFLFQIFVLSLFSMKLFGAPISHADTEFPCFDQSTAQKYISSFNIDLSSFGGLELCNSAVDTKKLLNDFYIVENGTFSGIGSNPLIRQFVPSANYYSWLKSQTRSVERGNDIPFATAYNRGGHFTMQDGWAKLSTLGRVGTIIHEARHTAGYTHIPCKQGSYNNTGLDACDVNYPNGGSHAVEMEYYARVAILGSNFHPVYQSMARLMAMARANFVFNQPILQKREALLAIADQTQAPFLIDQNQVFHRQSSSIKGQLKRSSSGASILSGTTAYALDMYKDTQSTEAVQDFYTYFKLLTMPATGNLIDLEEVDSNGTRYVVSVNNMNQYSTYNFPQGKWNSFKTLNFQFGRFITTHPEGKSGLWAISRTGEIIPFNFKALQFEAAEKSHFSSDSITYAKSANNELLVLKNDGLIYIQTPSGLNLWSESRNLPRIEQMVNVPLYDSFLVE